MRHWINLVEGRNLKAVNESAPNWHSMSEEQLRAYADNFVGMATDEMGDPDDLSWSLEWVSLDELDGVSLWCSWEDYYKDDVKGNSRYPEFQEGDAPFHTPIVMSFENDEAILWDGYHRVATACHRGDDTIWAIVGREK